MREQRMFRAGVGTYSPPTDSTIIRGDLVQLDPVAYSGGGIGIVMSVDVEGYYDIHTETHSISIHKSWLHRVGRAKFWPDGKLVEDDEVADTAWGRIQIAS